MSPARSLLRLPPQPYSHPATSSYPRFAARKLARPSKPVPSSTRSYASTTSEAANAAASTTTKAKNDAQQMTSKASEGLTRVTSSAGSMVSRLGPALSRTLGGIGGRTGRLIGFVQGLAPPTIYYYRVSKELSKMVFQGQKMYPPTMAEFQSYLNPIIHALRNPSSLFSANPGLLRSFQNPQQYLNVLRNMSQQQLIAYSIIAAEVLGFYKVGEVVGRLKLVGYRGGGHVEHH